MIEAIVDRGNRQTDRGTEVTDRYRQMNKHDQNGASGGRGKSALSNESGRSSKR